jgi:two-component sensor histidine kinase
MTTQKTNRTVEKLLRQQAALAEFGTFAFKQTDLQLILSEAARICAASLGVPFCKICRHRPEKDDLLIVAGCGWHADVVGQVVSQADETSPQGRAYVTREPVIIRDVRNANNLALPAFYAEHGIVSTVDVVIPAVDETPYGVLEIDSPTLHQYDVHDINFLTGFANVLAAAVATAQRNKAMTALLARQKLLAEELQHRVRNNLQLVSTMLSGYARTAFEGEARDGINLISRQVVTLATVYDSLLGVGLGEMIDLNLYLKKLCAALPGLQAARAKQIELVWDMESIMVALDTVTALGMVTSELVTNSYRHAFPDREGKITVTLARAEERTATLTVSDDGIGFSSDREISGHGMGLVHRLIAGIDGTLRVASVDGTRWTVEFPLSA